MASVFDKNFVHWFRCLFLSCPTQTFSSCLKPFPPLSFCSSLAMLNLDILQIVLFLTSSPSTPAKADFPTSAENFLQPNRITSLLFFKFLMTLHCLKGYLQRERVLQHRRLFRTQLLLFSPTLSPIPVFVCSSPGRSKSQDRWD